PPEPLVQLARAELPFTVSEQIKRMGPRTASPRSPLAAPSHVVQRKHLVRRARWARVVHYSNFDPALRQYGGFMKYVDVDGIGRVSRIGLGTWQFGSGEWGYGDSYASGTARDIVARALALGVTLFDTAEVYAMGKSERIL